MAPWRILVTLLPSVACLITATGQTFWYNGDFNDVHAHANEVNTYIEYAKQYDDFDVPEGGRMVGSAWSHNLAYGLDNVVEAEIEVRRGISEGNGGELLFARRLPCVMYRTGRSGFGMLEFGYRVRDVGYFLRPGPYFLNVAPVGFGRGRSFASETTGENGIGTPLNNGNSFFDAPLYGFYFTANDPYWGYPHDFSQGIAAGGSAAESYDVTQGTVISGSLARLVNPDDRRLVIRPSLPISLSRPSAEIVVQATAGAPPLPRLKIRIETACSGIPSTRARQRLELFSFTSNRWVLHDERIPSVGDSIVEAELIDGADDYVEPNTLRTWCRIGWYDRGLLNLSWTASVDQVVWFTGPR
ncbi:MAG: hypothetical protein H0W86_08730 [Armatimonadetes bacterium]|nr:hypothetical protein [Armatimonadota bacterium]